MDTTTMVERPMVFTADSVSAIQQARHPKTHTRRVMREPWKVQLLNQTRGDYPIGHTTWATAGRHVVEHNDWGAVSVRAADGKLLGIKPNEFEWVLPWGRPGDRLWVRETWAVPTTVLGAPNYLYMADGKPIIYAADVGEGFELDGLYQHWRSPRFMPRWASRLTLEIVSVRVERLQAIGFDDICREMGAPLRWPGPGAEPYVRSLAAMREYFAMKWDDINGRRAPWASNPWVAVIEFKLLREATAHGAAPTTSTEPVPSAA